MTVDLSPRLAALLERVADTHGYEADAVLEQAVASALRTPATRDAGPVLDEALIGPLFAR